MAKCDEGYLCEVCGDDVGAMTDSDLYLRYVIGMLDPEVLHTTRERHQRCNRRAGLAPPRPCSRPQAGWGSHPPPCRPRQRATE